MYKYELKAITDQYPSLHAQDPFFWASESRQQDSMANTRMMACVLDFIGGFTSTLAENLIGECANLKGGAARC